MKISKHEARKIALKCQLLDGQERKGKQGLIDAIRHLGYIQIDTISVVERAHHHTIWTRVRDYKHQTLDQLQTKDRKIFEHWSHAMSYLPMEHYRFSLPLMARQKESLHEEGFYKENKKLFADILGRIEKEGALSSKDFEAPEGHRSGGWWSWKPAKEALERLFRTGELLISHRKGFQKFYDLPERIIPKKIDTSTPTKEELFRHKVIMRIRSLGTVTLSDIGWFVRDKTAVKKTVAELQKEGLIKEIEIDGLDEKHYALCDNLESADKDQTLKTYILSPFDNLIINRNYAKRLFDLDYTIECYTKPEKRKYGYFSLPILQGTNFIGLMDAKAERKEKALAIRNLHLFEMPKKAELESLIKEIKGFAHFNCCDEARLEKSNLPKIASKLNEAFNQGG